MTRSLALGIVPAILLTILIGCGVQHPPQQVAQNTDQAAEKKDDPNVGKPTDGRGDVDMVRGSLKGFDVADAKPDSNGVQQFGLTKPQFDPTTTGLGTQPMGGAGGVSLGLSPNRALVVPASPSGFSAAGLGKAKGAGLGRPEPKALPAAGNGQPAAGEGHDGANAERYGTYLENEFRSPLVAALSTFSADVNTASYSNVRRMLNAGHAAAARRGLRRRVRQLLPIPVRYAEGRRPRRVQPRNGAVPVEPQAPPRPRRRAGVPDRDRQDCPPRNLVFLIDTSGSMNSPNRLPLVKQALNLLDRSTWREGPRQHRDLRGR